MIRRRCAGYKLLLNYPKSDDITSPERGVSSFHKVKVNLCTCQEVLFHRGDSIKFQKRGGLIRGTNKFIYFTYFREANLN